MPPTDKSVIGETTMAELAAALKMAKSREMYFAFINKGSDGMLVVSRSEISPGELLELKKEAGGGTIIEGTLSGPLGDLVFTVEKEPPPTLPAAIKKVVKRDAGIAINPIFQVK
jgi:hypothetical protein